MKTDLLSALTSFLDMLARAPHPDAVAGALVSGPGAHFGARSGAVLAARPPLLLIHGLHGYDDIEVTGLESISLEGDYPLCRAYREGELLIDSNATVGSRYADMDRPDGRWGRLRLRMPEGSTVSAPITSGGRVVGAYALTCEGARDWSTLDLAVLNAVSNALGLWLTHPDSGLPANPDSVTPALTPRQAAILAGVAAGRTNPAIAASLGYSDSTVKQEMQRVMRMLAVDSRSAAARRAGELGLIPDVDA